MRQVGVLAAAGLIALDRMVDRLAEDHANARILAEALAELPGVTCDLTRVETNMVYIGIADAPRVIAECRSRGLLAEAVSQASIRLVTHCGIEAADVQRAIR